MILIGRVEGIHCPLIFILLQEINFDTLSRHPHQRMRSNSRLWHHLLFKTSGGVQCLRLMSRNTVHQFGLLDDLAPEEVRLHEMVQGMEVRATEVQAMEVQGMVAVPRQLLSTLAVRTMLCPLHYGNLDLFTMILVLLRPLHYGNLDLFTMFLVLLFVLDLSTMFPLLHQWQRRV